MTRRRWTSDDISKLKSMAQKHPAAKIAEELGRGAAATMVKAHELKVSLRYRKPSGAETMPAEAAAG